MGNKFLYIELYYNLDLLWCDVALAITI